MEINQIAISFCVVYLSGENNTGLYADQAWLRLVCFKLPAFNAWYDYKAIVHSHLKYVLRVELKNVTFEMHLFV